MATPPDPFPANLRFGSIDLDVGHGALGPIRANGVEVLRRIFVTLRDDAWREVPPTQWHVAREGEQVLSIRAVHAELARWDGRLSVAPSDSRLTFDFEATVLADIEVCRFGLVVLCAPELLAGGSIVTKAAGHSENLTLSELIAPQPIVDGLPAGLTEPFEDVALLPRSGGEVSLRLSGDRFEIEDQRNWGDASFKIYCTPLSLGFPRTLARGTPVAHAIEATWHNLARLDAQSEAAVAERSAPLEVLAQSEPEGATAGVHFVAGSWNALPGSKHSKVDVACDPSILESGDRLPVRGARRCLLTGNGLEPPTSEQVADLTSRLRHCGEDAAIFAASRGHFVEFNRRAPLPEGCDGFAFCYAPTAHARDRRTIMENVDALSAMVGTLRALTGCARIVVSPVEWAQDDPAGSEADPRDVALWLAALLIVADRAGVESLTLHAALAARAARDPAFADLARLIDALEAGKVVHRKSSESACYAVTCARATFAVNLGDHEALVENEGLPRRRSVAPGSLSVFAIADERSERRLSPRESVA